MATITNPPVNATNVLTFAGQAVADEQIVLGSKTYTWKASVTTTDGQIKIGATVAASAQNLYDAINLSGTPGTQYGSNMVRNPQVRAIAVTATTVTVQARVPGTVGNFITATETMTSASWSAATLLGGTFSLDDAIKDVLARDQVPASVAQSLIEWAYDPATV